MKTNKLWAPWRLKYIKNAAKEKGCLFCRVSKAKNDEKNLIFYRSKHSFGMLNLYPYNNGHAMAVPKRHLKSLEQLPDNELLDLMKTVNHIKIRLDKILSAHGYNIGINLGRVAGAGIEGHLHIHIVPRWSGDTNFMPSISGTKVISQSLSALYKEMKRVKK